MVYNTIMVKTEDGDLTDKGYLMEKIKKHINRFREMLREGLQGKIFRLCLIVIAVAVCCFAVLDIIQLQ